MEENKEIKESKNVEEKVVMDPELIEFIKMEVEEKKKAREAEERKRALQQLKKYVPNLVNVPDKFTTKNIYSIVKFLKACDIKPDEERRPSFKLDVKRNITFWALLGAIVVVGIVGVIF